MAGGQRAGVADEAVRLIVPEHQLQLRKLFAQLAPMAQERLAVAEVLGERVLDLAGARSEVGALRVREHPHGGHSTLAPTDDPCLLPATAQASALRAGIISAVELV